MITSKKEWDKKYYQKNRQRLITKQREYCNKNKEKIKKYREKNQKRIKEYMKGYRKKESSKEAKKKSDKKYQEKHRETCRKYQRSYQKRWRENNPLKHKKTEKKYYEKNREKAIARAMSHIIVIPKNQICEFCNEELAIERHHQDYSKPLEVKFVCKECHLSNHRK